MFAKNYGKSEQYCLSYWLYTLWYWTTVYLIIVNVFLTISIYTCLLLCSFLTTGERPAEVLRNENHYEPLDRASAKDFVWNFDAGLCVILLIFITVWSIFELRMFQDTMEKRYLQMFGIKFLLKWHKMARFR